MRKRVAGAAILVAVGVGIWLGSLFRGLGPGGDGEGFGRSGNVSVNAGNSEVSLKSTPGEAATGEGNRAVTVPTVLIDGHDYLLQVGPDGTETFRPTDLDEIVRLAEEANPGSDGIRLRIKRRESSRASVETALENALRKAGIPQSEILDHPNLVE